MSMIRQVWMLILGIIVMACVGSVAVSVSSARDYLESQLALKNNDNAQSLALALSQQDGDAALAELALAAQFDTGYYRSLRLRAPDGKLLFERVAPARPNRVPQWFQRTVPIDSPAGVAHVSRGWSVVGRVEVVSDPAFVYPNLWDSAVRNAQWMAALGVLAGLVGSLSVRQLRRPLDAMVEQARALMERRFVEVAEPPVPELRRVAQAMNTMVARVRTMHTEQMDQIEQLGRLANCDSLTGVSHRRHFLHRLDDELAREAGTGRGLLALVRLGALAQANRQLGHALTDGLLRQAARVLETAAPGGHVLAVGRLNGTDFAVLIDAQAEIEPTLTSLIAGVQAVFEPFEQASVVASCVIWHRDDVAGDLMQAADGALARAELRGNGAFELVGTVAQVPTLPGGEEAWRKRLNEALATSSLSLAEYPVLDHQGRVIHVECPLRVRFEAQGRPEPAATWLPYAVRTGLIGRLDLAAVELALARIEVDGLPRGVNIATAALAEASFLPLLRGLLNEQRDAASRLSLEVDESVLVAEPAALAMLCRELRPMGVQVGIEHAGERVAKSGALLTAGLDFVKLRASFVAGVAAHETQAILVRGTVAALHGLDIQVHAQGVADAADLAALWQLGLDGATGPAVREPRTP